MVQAGKKIENIAHEWDPYAELVQYLKVADMQNLSIDYTKTDKK